MMIDFSGWSNADVGAAIFQASTEADARAVEDEMAKRGMLDAEDVASIMAWRARNPLEHRP